MENQLFKGEIADEEVEFGEQPELERGVGGSGGEVCAMVAIAGLHDSGGSALGGRLGAVSDHRSDHAVGFDCEGERRHRTKMQTRSSSKAGHTHNVRRHGCGRRTARTCSESGRENRDDATSDPTDVEIWSQR
jgi:hypothetical protein